MMHIYDLYDVREEYENPSSYVHLLNSVYLTMLTQPNIKRSNSIRRIQTIEYKSFYYKVCSTTNAASHTGHHFIM